MLPVAIHTPGATQSSYERIVDAKAPEKLGFDSSIGNRSSSSSYPNMQPFPARLCHLGGFFVLAELVGWVSKCRVIFMDCAIIVFGGSAVLDDSVLCCESTSGSREVIRERSFSCTRIPTGLQPPTVVLGERNRSHYVKGFESGRLWVSSSPIYKIAHAVLFLSSPFSLKSRHSRPLWMREVARNPGGVRSAWLGKHIGHPVNIPAINGHYHSLQVGHSASSTYIPLWPLEGAAESAVTLLGSM